MNHKTMVWQLILDLVIDFQFGRDLTEKNILSHCTLGGKPYLLFSLEDMHQVKINLLINGHNCNLVWMLKFNFKSYMNSKHEVHFELKVHSSLLLLGELNFNSLSMSSLIVSLCKSWFSLFDTER